MARKQSNEADAIVIGGGPAGATAAMMLARGGVSVILVDAMRFPRPRPCGGWLNAQGGDLLKDLGLPVKELTACSIDEVIFANKDFSKTARPKLKTSPGYLVDRASFDHALVKAAKAAGADIREEFKVTALRPRENGVEVASGDKPGLHGKLLIVACGIGGGLLRQVGIVAPPERTTTWSAQVERSKPKSKSTAPVRAIVAVGLSADGAFAMAFDRPDRLVVQVNITGTQQTARAKLVEICSAMAKHNMTSEDLSADAATKSIAVPTYPFSALEMESHVGKHTLVVGGAGGFYASASQEGLFPAMWSARIAAKVLLQAGVSTYSQDGLMNFDTAWRLEMGDFLRPPNTDLQLLMPLIFTNQPMADRMAAAFFSGENI
jgi:flavin-dependent dehydrogenase